MDEIAPVTGMLSPGASFPHLVSENRVDIFGQSEAGARVQLLHDDIPTDETLTSSLAESTAYPIDPDTLAGFLSTDGQVLIEVVNSSRFDVTHLADGSTQIFYCS